MAMKRLVFATDFSAYSGEALEYAVQFALTLGAELYLLHVFERPFFAEPGVSHSIQLRHGVDQWIRDLKAEESQKLEALAKEVRGRGVTVHPLFKEGIPFVEILKTAEEMPADLLVLGTHGRTGLAHVLIGSVAQRVVQRAKCPVLTVRPAALGGAKPGSSGPT
jgi:nucleotide-binding universal stress UspA family protein